MIKDPIKLNETKNKKKREGRSITGTIKERVIRTSLDEIQTRLDKLKAKLKDRKPYARKKDKIKEIYVSSESKRD